MEFRFNLPRVLVTSVAAAALAVGGAAAEVAAAGPAAAKTGPVLAFTPSPGGFGAVTIGQKASQTLKLANTGGTAARAVQVALSGPAAFAITGDTCSGTSLMPGKSCTVTVQFAPPSPGTVTSANLDGTGVTTLVTGLAAPQGVAVDGSHIYWAEDAPVGGGPGTVMAANLDGTGVTTLVTGQDMPVGMAVDASHIYWVDTNINEANLDGTNPHSLISGLNFGFNGVAAGPQ